MSKHTPGPWEARWSERGQYWFIDHEQGGEGYTLTKLNCEEANARLIAAAPELLELARQIVLAAEQDEGEIPSDIVAGAKAAIAKAGG
jgi:hypothetical protein